MDFVSDAPFLRISTDHLEGDLGKTSSEQVVAFGKLMQALHEMITDKLPGIVEAAEALPPQAEEVKRDAEPQFERLDMMAKAKAMAALAKNMKNLAKVPKFFKEALENQKQQMQDVKEFVEDVKNNQAQYGENGKKCYEGKHHLPPLCYEHVHGPINYSKDDRREWEHRVRGNHNGTFFDPSSVPKNNMK